MKILIASIAALAIATPAMAALAPDYQRAAEIKAVVDSASEVMAGGGETIQGVTYIGVDVYEVSYENCTVRVDIVDTERDESAPQMVGPRQFDAVAGEPDCGQ